MNGHEILERPSPWDKLGILISGACLLHCGLVPVLSILPAIGALKSEHEGLHHLLLSLALPVALLALIPAVKKHGKLEIIIFAGLGLLLLAAGLVFHALEQPLTLAGAALLGLAHIENWRSCRVQRGDCCDH